ncbi:ACT domain-containing protein ACR2 isoform X1 [Cucurbita moschata]|uniref:ACT domain-containing protein ACR n=2 Tax=Cucurbita moschata TaxID=3662 RepID=A0A6J1FNB0_CUCMO|nr:ACT domain-containing protein ACR2 isoform X1 [Cucurbita moschata]
MKNVCWPYFDPEFDTLPERINGPTCRVCIDNESMEDCTIVKVDSLNKQGLLLEVVQILTDLNLSISKSYISCDAGWFMDGKFLFFSLSFYESEQMFPISSHGVLFFFFCFFLVAVFHVKDENSHKLTDQKVINSIQQAIGTTKGPDNSAKTRSYADSLLKSDNSGEHTAIEMTGTDRPGLFSEISAALADLHCNVVEAHAWSHNARLACIAYISDQSTDSPIEDPHRLATIEEHLSTVLRAATAPLITSWAHTLQQEVKTSATITTNVERRLHQLLLSVKDYDWTSESISKRRKSNEEWRKITVRIESCDQKGYSIVSIECKDRPRLMFDTVCTLTDMQYVIFHASISSKGDNAFQEYFIRHVNGYALNSENDKQRVVKCLEAAIERRVCEGVRLELCANNRVGLLSDITRVLRENGLNVVRADIATQGEKAINAFYVKDISGKDVDMEMVESMKKEIGSIVLRVKNETSPPSTPQITRSRFSFSDMLKSQIERLSHNFIAIRH